jgi:hypothetical protein
MLYVVGTNYKAVQLMPMYHNGNLCLESYSQMMK